MQVNVVPLTSFVHGSITADEGKPINIEESIALDLERAGLVRIQSVPAKKGASGKVLDDGPGQPSSVSPAAQASQMKMSRSSKPGGGKHRKAGK